MGSTNLPRSGATGLWGRAPQKAYLFQVDLVFFFQERSKRRCYVSQKAVVSLSRLVDGVLFQEIWGKLLWSTSRNYVCEHGRTNPFGSWNAFGMAALWLWAYLYAASLRRGTHIGGRTRLDVYHACANTSWATACTSSFMPITRPTYIRTCTCMYM